MFAVSYLISPPEYRFGQFKKKKRKKKVNQTKQPKKLRVEDNIEIYEKQKYNSKAFELAQMRNSKVSDVIMSKHNTTQQNILVYMYIYTDIIICIYVTSNLER